MRWAWTKKQQIVVSDEGKWTPDWLLIVGKTGEHEEILLTWNIE
jgi:hypothetical protein